MPPANIVWGVYRNRPVCPSVRTNFHIFCPISTKLEFKIMMCELCSIKDCIVHWALPLSCLFGLRNFETIQYAHCDCKFSYMINQKFMKLCTLQDPNMKMCTLVVYLDPSSFPRIMSLKVVFQICFGSIKMMGMQGVLIPHSGQLSYSIYVSMRDWPASSSTPSSDNQRSITTCYN
jgi:hypothetical protein